MCVCVQVAACDSMNMLMKKLDHLEAQSANSSYRDEADADEERQSTVVSREHNETASNNSK